MVACPSTQKYRNSHKFKQAKARYLQTDKGRAFLERKRTWHDPRRIRYGEHGRAGVARTIEEARALEAHIRRLLREFTAQQRSSPCP